VREVDQTHDLGNTMLDAAIETVATQEQTSAIDH